MKIGDKMPQKIWTKKCTECKKVFIPSDHEICNYCLLRITRKMLLYKLYEKRKCD